MLRHQSSGSCSMNGAMRHVGVVGHEHARPGRAPARPRPTMRSTASGSETSATAAMPPVSLDHLVQPGRGHAVVHRHPRALGGQPPGDRPAEALARAADQSHPCRRARPIRSPLRRSARPPGRRSRCPPRPGRARSRPPPRGVTSRPDRQRGQIGRVPRGGVGREQRRVGRPGGDAVDPDAARRELGAQRAGEADDRALGGGVVRVAVAARDRQLGRDRSRSSPRPLRASPAAPRGTRSRCRPGAASSIRRQRSGSISATGTIS